MGQLTWSRPRGRKTRTELYLVPQAGGLVVVLNYLYTSNVIIVLDPKNVVSDVDWI